MAVWSRNEWRGHVVQSYSNITVSYRQHLTGSVSYTVYFLIAEPSADVGAIDAWIFLWNHLKPVFSFSVFVGLLFLWVHLHWSNVLLRCPRLDQQPHAFRARIYTARKLLRVCLTILTTCEVPSSIFVTDLESGCCLHRIEIQEITRYRYGLWVVVFCWYPLPRKMAKMTKMATVPDFWADPATRWQSCALGDVCWSCKGRWKLSGMREL